MDTTMESPASGQDGPATEDQSIGSLVEQTQTFTFGDPGSAIQAFFTGHPSAEGVVILDGLSPRGLVMRNDFYQKIGSLYGRDLFMNRPIKLIMNARPLVVDVSVDIATIGLIAMNRPHDQIYDLVLITDNENYAGVVSIKRFMVELSRNREKQITLLKKQKDILRQKNENEIRNRKQIEEKSQELRQKNDAIKNLMDNAGQGFLSFGHDMIVSGEYSLECVQILHVPVAGRNFVALMARHVSPETAQTMSQVFASVFASDKSLREKVYLSLLPAAVSIYDRTVSIEYKIIQSGGQKRMMLILTDITEKKKLEARMIEERNNVKMVAKALTKQSDVNLALEELRAFAPAGAQAVVEGVSPVKAALAEIFRLVHTFKGDFAQLGLHNTAANLHAAEDRLAALAAREDTDKAELAAIVAGWDARRLLEDDVRILTEILGKSFFEKDERFRISAEMLADIEGQVRRLPEGAERRHLLVTLGRLRLRPLKGLLAEYQEYVQALAGRLGKSVGPLRISGDDVFVDKERLQKFVKSLVHIFRNMLDHGIETPEERLEAGKCEQGTIKCKIKQAEHAVSLSLADDGRGIDAAKVLRVAAAKGLIGPEQGRNLPLPAVYDLLFVDSFSTKEAVSALSGRGVGLSAVKAEIERLGGTITVTSEPGQGSKFTFHFPAPEQGPAPAGDPAA